MDIISKLRYPHYYQLSNDYWFTVFEHPALNKLELNNRENIVWYCITMTS